MSIQVKMHGTPEQREQFEAFYRRIKNRTLANSLMLRVAEGMLSSFEVTIEDLISDVLAGAKPDLNDDTPYTVRLSDSKTPYLSQLYQDGDWGLKHSIIMSVCLRAIDLFLSDEDGWKRYSRIVRSSANSSDTWRVAPAVIPDDELPASRPSSVAGSVTADSDPTSAVDQASTVSLEDVEDMSVFDQFDFDSDDLSEADADQFLNDISNT